MKKFLKGAFLALMAMVAMTSCVEDDSKWVAPLDVTPNNIAGSWRLDSWSGGELAEGSFVYIDFVRADRTYTLYQNIDSQSTRVITGRYYIENDAEFGAIIRGSYDYGNGDWAHRYIVTNLTEDSMMWTAKDNPEDVSIYIRADIPADLKEE